ncbi:MULTISPECIES: hypothetical protein [unclassified Rathayibacter]|uniref:hypothetical protein n=1 Tax=unclassified Rathayibacter TaxID=2609250 RepID=UPI000CE921F5|nr:MULTISPECIES: hypothetical protein [unclassified Rathayibacter]PPG82524.1 hypothetical protein C5C29_13855 [Rathayibacter sp. AY1H2]PPH01261.1 hypothetical protein C5C44_14270 [Rathayibacter sp. AY1F6]
MRGVRSGGPDRAAAADAVATLLALVGTIGGVVAGVLAGLGAAVSGLLLAGCASTYRSTFLEVQDPPIDCLAGPAWPFLQWFPVVGVGAVLAFAALVIGAYRPRWSVPISVVLAAATAGFAMLMLPGGGA